MTLPNTQYPIPNTKNSVNIFILIDALGWDYIKDRSFLDDIAVTKRPVKSILGFSSGVIPSILTGRYPQEHKHWSLYFYSPKTSPFKWTKSLLRLPKKILNSRVGRKIIEEISKRLMGYSGYFETYLIPIEKLHLFDICENRNIYAPGGMRSAQSIFDILKEMRINYRCFTYPLKDKDVFEKTKNSLINNENLYYFLYLSESDALLHKACQDKGQVEKMIDYYEGQIKSLYAIAKEKYRDVNLYIFSDHSMAPVNCSFDLKEDIEALRYKMPEDYIVFYDSTMARFWFFNLKAKQAITYVLNTRMYGRILSNDELKAVGVGFDDNMYGETIFLMNTGSVICPSFMGSKVPQGMHGYSVNDGVMDAVLVSNKKIEEEISDVKDFFKLMLPGHQVARSQGKTKILYFLNSLVRGGVEEHVLQLIDKIDKQQFEPLLVCPQELTDLMKEDLARLKIKVYPICIRKWTNIKEVLKFLKILRSEKPDIVHSHLFFATMFAAPIAKLAGVPKVIETAHIREAWRKGIKKTYFIDRFFYRFVDRIIAVSNAVKKYLVSEKSLPEDKIKVIYNGVDLDRFALPNTQYPIPNTNTGRPFNIGVIGRLEPQKGHKYFLEAVSMLGDKRNDATFSIIGEGSLRNELERMSHDLKIESKVNFLGFRKDVAEIISQLDIVVLPSLYEGLPLVALEAGAIGKPIIATDVDGSPEVVVNNKTGFIVAPADSLALKKGIEKLANDKNMAFELGINARKHVEENFDIKKQLAKTEALYLSLIGKTT